MYYMTLVITPMILLSGVFFPSGSLPELIQVSFGLLPLRHIVEMVRPLMAGEPVASLYWHLLVPALFGLFSALIAVARIKRRLLQ